MEVNKNRIEMCLVCGSSFNSSIPHTAIQERRNNHGDILHLQNSTGENADILIEWNKMWTIFCKYFHLEEEVGKEKENPSQHLHLNSRPNSSDNKNTSKSGNEKSMKRKPIPIQIKMPISSSFPFCAACKTNVLKLCELDEKLSHINLDIAKTVTEISSTIVQSVCKEKKTPRHSRRRRENKEKTTESPSLQNSENDDDEAKENLAKNIRRARRTIYSRWSPRVKIARVESQNLDATPISVSTSIFDSEENAQTENMQTDENETIELPAHLSEIQILKEIPNNERELEARNKRRNLSPKASGQTEIPTTPKTPEVPRPALKSILKTTTTPSAKNNYKQGFRSVNNHHRPRGRFQVVDCGNGSYVYDSIWRFYECSRGFICGVTRCTFWSKWKDGILNHLLIEHADKSTTHKIRRRFRPPIPTITIPSTPNTPHHIQAATPQRKVLHAKPTPKKLTFNQTALGAASKLQVKLERLTEAPRLPATIIEAEPPVVPLPVAASEAEPAVEKVTPVKRLSRVKTEKRDRTTTNQSHTISRSERVRLSKAMELLLETVTQFNGPVEA